MIQPGRRRTFVALALCGGAAWLAFGEPASAATAQKESRGLVVLDSKTGRERWHASLPDGQLFGAPALGAGLVVAGSARCGDAQSGEPPALTDRVQAFDAKTGRRLWAHGATSGAATMSQAYSKTPTVGAAASGVVVVLRTDQGGRVTGLNARSGTMRWRLERGRRFVGVSRRLVFAAGGSGTAPVRAFDRRTGKPRWKFPTQPDPAWTDRFDVVAANDRTVVIATGETQIRHGDDPSGITTLFVLDARTGVERDRLTAADPNLEYSDFVIDGDHLIYADGAAAISRDLRSGAIRWSRPLSGIFRGQRAIQTSTDGGTTFLLELNSTEALETRTGVTRWKTPGDQPQFLEAADRTRVIAGGQIGQDYQAGEQLYGFDARKGTELWRLRTKELFDAPGQGYDIAVRGRTVAINHVCEDMG